MKIVGATSDMKQDSDHLSEDQIVAFVLGKLPQAAQDAVEIHLSVCDACSTRAEAANPADAFVDLLSDANAESVHLSVVHERAVPANGQANETASFDELPRASPLVTLAPTLSESAEVAGLPSELVNHPRYRVIRLLGRGGMGSVWLAEHLVMRRHVALKMIRPEFLLKPTVAERFQREVEVTAKLNNAHIAAAYDAEQIGERFLLVMEFVPGHPLTDLMARGPLNVPTACEIVRQAALGLECAHATGLTHRDIKPGNIILTPEGTAKIVDFGLAFAPGSESAITVGNIVMGTPDYVAPEQAVNPRAADARSDIYSLGCTLYHLLAGHPPFPSGSMVEKIDAQRYRTPPNLDNVPSALAEFVVRMLAKNPDQRIQTAAEVAVALQAFCKFGGELRVGSEPAPPSTANRWRRVLLGMCAVTSIVSLAVIAQAIRTPNGHELPLSSGHQPAAASAPTSPLKIAASEGTLREIRLYNEGLARPSWRTKVVFSPNGQTVYASSAAYPEATLAWERDSGRLTYAIPHFSGFGFSLSPDGKWLTNEMPDHRLAIAESQSGSIVRHYEGCSSLLWSAAVSPGGEYVAASDQDGGVKMWDRKSGEIVWETHSDTVTRNLVFSANSEYFMTVGAATSVWRLRDFTEVFRREEILGMDGEFFSDGTRVIVSSESDVLILAVATGDVLRRFHGDGVIEALNLAPDERHFATVDIEGDVCWWDVNDEVPTHRSKAHLGGALDVAIDPTGDCLLTSGKDGAVRLWRIPTTDKAAGNQVRSASTAPSGT